MRPPGAGDNERRAAAGYEVLFELGAGGMGKAFLARAAGSEGFERLVVIKRLHAEQVTDADAVSRFLREARIAAAIHHANVAGTQHVGSDERGPFIVLDYVDGANFGELGDHCSMLGVKLPVRIALRVALDVLAGLEAVHGATNARGIPLKILHRDVSLENILVGRDGVARLSDFGVAKSEPFGAAPSKQRYLVGKLPYVSPEYLRGKTIGPASDVYALGVVLWVALAGMDPWPEEDDAAVMRHIIEDGFPPLPERHGVAPEVVSLVMQACAPAVSERFESARQMSDAIELLAQELKCVASHREVAAWVEEVMGPQLERRRARIAAFAEPSPAVEGVERRAEGPFAPPRAGSARTLAPWQLFLRRRRRQLWGAAGLVVSAGLAALVWRSAGRSRPDMAHTPPVPREIAARAEAPQPAVAPARAVVEVGAVVPPVPSALLAPSALPSAAPRPEPKPAVRRPPALRAPDSIKRANPYR